MERFYNDWMKHHHYWFNQFDGFDNYISTNYGYLIDSYQYENDKNPIIGILIYDQLTRHFYRKEQANHIITYFNRKALEIALDNNNDDFISKLNYDDWSFYILVFRHTNERHYLLFAMKEALLRGNKSFIKATFSRANFKEELDLYDCASDYYSYYDNTSFDTNILDVFHEDFNIFQPHYYFIGDYSELKIGNKKIIVSLSGGVDSISCLYTMVQIFGNKAIVALHINYNNRIETKDEVKFLIWICSKLKVRLYIRTIKEISRKYSIDNDMREVYEDYTKRVRFNSYKRVNEYENNDCEPIVILGHNKDDCIENILTNITYKNKYDNLNGIELSMLIDNINFYRPLINVSKQEIYNFANRHHLSYLKNSTPSWCQRGQIRNNVVPVLDKWDPRFIPGLTNLTSILKDLHINLYLTINTNFNYENEIDIHNLNTSVLYWKYGIFKLFNFYPSNKSLQSLITRLEQFKHTYQNREINKKTNIVIKNSLSLVIWRTKTKNGAKYTFTGTKSNSARSPTQLHLKVL